MLAPKATALALPILVAAIIIAHQAWALANPASVFCGQSGGRSEILQTASGAQLGICILPGGEIVEEWAYFRAAIRRHRRGGERRTEPGGENG